MFDLIASAFVMISALFDLGRATAVETPKPPPQYAICETAAQVECFDQKVGSYRSEARKSN